MTSDVAGQILDFLRREDGKPHSADDLAALLKLDRAEVDTALQALHEQGAAAPEDVTGYGGSQTVWALSQR
ncbi:MarR family transcriptional regulator [Deinococcus hohokamensis]|uniref:MarR family transcriptional regulator n=1 Tax=Deinococcus hohokamensis TaxID=309883 RepID=A0ABV9IAQ3_9DEIO